MLRKVGVRDSSCESSVVAGPHDQPHPAELRDQELAALHEALKQRGSLSIWFDPDIVWVPPPTGIAARRDTLNHLSLERPRKHPSSSLAHRTLRLWLESILSVSTQTGTITMG